MWRYFYQKFGLSDFFVSRPTLCVPSLTWVHSRLRQAIDHIELYFHRIVSLTFSFFPLRSVVYRMPFPMIFQKFTSICPMVDEGQRICSEGLVSLSVLLVTGRTAYSRSK